MAFGLEEECGYYAPAFWFPNEEADLFIPARTASLTEIEDVDVTQRLRDETTAAYAQFSTIRSMLGDIICEAEKVGR